MSVDLELQWGWQQMDIQIQSLSPLVRLLLRGFLATMKLLTAVGSTMLHRLRIQGECMHLTKGHVKKEAQNKAW